MPILILILFMGLFLHDAMASSFAAPPALGAVAVAAAVLAPKIVVGALFSLICVRTRRAMGGKHGHRALRRQGMFVQLTQFLIPLLFFCDLFIVRALAWVRFELGGGVISNPLLIDELLVLLPVLALQTWMWMALYPIDRRQREAALMRHLDEGKSPRLWSRGQYVLFQMRLQWVLLGAPLLLILAWQETVRLVWGGRVEDDELASIVFAGSIAIFVVAPLIVRYLWDTAPLPRGELREHLMGMCGKYRVRVRELLLWKTSGAMINGAVMGVIGRLRYILLTDALLEQLPQRHIEAVMAHELAHIYRKHVFWLLVFAMASLILLERLFAWVVTSGFAAVSASGLSLMLPDPLQRALRDGDVIGMTALVGSLLGFFLVIGWVSRRFERQADTFAVQHMSRQWHDQPWATPQPAAVIAAQAGRLAASNESVRQMSADQLVAALTEGRALPVAALATTTAKEASGGADGAAKDAASGDGESAGGSAGDAPNVRGDGDGAAASAGQRQPGDDISRVPQPAAQVMVDALRRVMELNHIPTARRKRWWHLFSLSNWRHGSIEWRQDYLSRLPGQRIDDLPIDRQVKWIKLAGLLLLAAAVTVMYVQS